MTHTLDLINVCNGVLGGLVAVSNLAALSIGPSTRSPTSPAPPTQITAPCATVRPWASLICGGLVGPIFYAGSALMKKLRIDDVVDAVALHAGCGAWGLIFTGLLSAPELVDQVYSVAETEKAYGAFFPHSNGHLLGAQLIEILVITAWTGGFIGIYFFILRLLGKHRVSEQQEMMGIDLSKHGGSAYNVETVDDKVQIVKSAM